MDYLLLQKYFIKAEGYVFKIAPDALEILRFCFWKVHSDWTEQTRNIVYTVQQPLIGHNGSAMRQTTTRQRRWEGATPALLYRP